MNSMTSLLIWNLMLAAAMAAAVLLLSRTRKLRERPAIRHCLWLLVLCRLISPPLVPLPMLSPESDAAENNVPTSFESSLSVSHTSYITATPVLSNSATSTDAVVGDSLPATISEVMPAADLSSGSTGISFQNVLSAALIVSLIVTLVLITRLLLQLRRFSRLLSRGDFTNVRLNRIAADEARRIGGIPDPAVCTVRSRITPLLWLQNRRPLIVLPESLATDLSDEQLACVVRHELAHFVRRDHWSNALACFVSSLFWWNPVVWLARRVRR